MCPIELAPVGTHGKKQFVIFFGEYGDIESNYDRFKAHLGGNQGIITGVSQGREGNIGHAVYWDGEACFDHKGKWNLWDTEFIPSTFWRAMWM